MSNKIRTHPITTPTIEASVSPLRGGVEFSKKKNSDGVRLKMFISWCLLHFKNLLYYYS